MIPLRKALGEVMATVGTVSRFAAQCRSLPKPRRIKPLYACRSGDVVWLVCDGEALRSGRRITTRLWRVRGWTSCGRCQWITAGREVRKRWVGELVEVVR